MNSGYGQIFLLLLAIALILLGASGRAKAVWDALRGETSVGNKTGLPAKETEKPAATIGDYDKAGSGSGGVIA